MRPGGLAVWRDAAELALSELTTDAVLHAGRGRGRERGGPRARSYYGTQASTGRGLALVAAVAHEHGIERTPNGKVVWFTLRDEPAQPDEQDLDALLDDWGDDDLDAPAPAPPDGGRTVTLARFPATLWLAAVEMHDALLRELAAADRVRFAIRAALDQALAHEGVQALARSPLPVSAGRSATWSAAASSRSSRRASARRTWPA